MSLIASTWAWTITLKNPRTKLLLLKLADSANDEGVCWPSLRTLAIHTGISKSTISRHTKILEEEGLIKIEERFRLDGSRGANVYLLQLPPELLSRLSGHPASRSSDKAGVPPKVTRGVSHPEREAEPSEEPSEEPKDGGRRLPAPRRTTESQWLVASSRQGKGPFRVDLSADPATCSCENRHDSECRHIRSARTAEELWLKQQGKLRHDAVWDRIVELFGPAGTRAQARALRASCVDDVLSVLGQEGIEPTPEEFDAEVHRRYVALTTAWGKSKVTAKSFADNFGLAGKLVKSDGDGPGVAQESLQLGGVDFEAYNR